jgi:predicted DNA binding CopG/RHH family protein
MKTVEKLTEALESAACLEKMVHRIIQDVNDYDLERLLKKIDAEFKDVQHNLIIARRLAESLARQPKEPKKAKKKSPLR